MIIQTFINCPIEVVTESDPEGNTVKTIVIQDPQTGHQYNYPMSAELAQRVGSKLIANGDIVVATANGSSKLRLP